MARVIVDNSANMYPGKVSLADLAQFVPVLETSSDNLNIYQVQSEMEKAFPFEIARFEFEYCNGYSCTFRDGSILHIGAYAECDNPEKFGWQ